MATVTDLVTQKKRDTRVNIYLDNTFCCGLEKITVLSEGIKIGDEITPERLAEIQQKSESATAFDRAVHYLSLRMRSEKEMRDYLAEKGYLPQVADRVLEKLKEYRYIDDEQFCRAYIADHRARYGEKMLCRELRRLGIGPYIIEDAMESLGDQTEEAEAAARKYIRTHAKADRNRVYTFLYAKGFTYDVIKDVMSVIEDDLQGEEPENFDAE